MKPKFMSPLLTVALLMFAGWAQAAASANCNISVVPNTFAGTYSVTAGYKQALSLTVFCTRTATGTLTAVFSLSPDNGGNASGSQNRAGVTPNFINYDIYTDNTCGTLLTNAFTYSLAIPSGIGSTASKVLTYEGCVPVQSPLPTAGGHNDTVTITLATSTAGVTITGSALPTFSVSITTTAVCSISTLPGTVAFGTYTAFGSALTANTTFGATCTTLLPYTMSLDANSGVTTNGLNYSLLLNTAGSGGSNTLNSTGTGLAQSFFINGTMAAGQAGTCTTGTCAGTDTRTLTVTY